MEKVAQNLHTGFLCVQVLDLLDYYSRVTIEWE